MIRNFVICLLTLCLAACEHSGYEISKFNGDYRYYAGIAEFFDCDTGVKYYVADAGIHTELQDIYTSLDVKEKEDIYMQVEGYTREEQQMEGIDPILVFVPVKLLSHDADRGCKRTIRQGR